MVMATQLIISLGIFILHLHYAVTDSSIMTIPLSRRIKIDRRKERKLSCFVALLTYILPLNANNTLNKPTAIT